MSDSNFLRIPGARPIKRQQKENKWDDRFWVGSMPSYNKKSDVHASNYLSSKGRKKKVVMAPGRIRKARSPVVTQNKFASRSSSHSKPAPNKRRPVISN